MTLGGLLTLCTELQCSEPRDRVFGLLGVLGLSAYGRPLPQNLVPDYTMSVADVYRDAIIACLDDHPGFWGLEQHGFVQSPEIGRLPSWVPYWYRADDNLHLDEGSLPDHTRIWPWKDPAMETPLFYRLSGGGVLSIKARS